MNRKSWSLFLALATGCAVALLVPNGKDAPQPPVQIAKSEPEFTQSGPARQPEHIVEFDSDFARQSNEFGLKLFREINKSVPSVGNVAISPISITQVLSLFANGAAGDTAEQLKKLLGVTGDLADFNTSNGAWLKSADEMRQVKLAIANSVWVNPGASIEPAFTHIAKQYNAEARVLSADSTTATNEVNAWVSDRTSGMIPHIIDNIMGINVLLANAVYFNGAWTLPFRANDTVPANFLSANGDKQICQMMTQADSFRYLKTEKAQVLRLTYGYGQPVAMLLILPSPDVSIEDTIDSLDAETYAGFSRQLTELEEIPAGSVQIPCFKIQYKQDLDSVFGALGFGSILKSGDFSGISADLQQDANSLLTHLAVVEVTETGTEAAATTQMFMYAGVPDVTENFHFRADRPFLFFIEQTAEEAGGLIIFAGVVREIPE